MRETGSKGCTVITIENGTLSAVEHRPVDKIRFERILINVDGARNIDDALERTIVPIGDAISAAEGRTLCARVELSGACAAYSVLLRRRVALLQQIRSLAFGIASDAVWIESVQTDLRPEGDSSGQTVLGVIDEEIHAALEELSASPDAFKSLTSAIEPMLRRLPLGLRQQIESNELVDPARLVHILKRFVLARLAEQEERA
jgi:hypothetical protein